MKQNEKLKLHTLSEIENLKVHGRTTGCLSPLTLFWTGSAIELNVKGSELWIEFEVDYDIYEPWISIVINSTPVSRQMLTAGRYWVCVFRGMNENAIKNVRIVKDLQAMNEDPGNSLQIHAVKTDGKFLPVEEKPYKIEFIGDSITSGEGIIGAKAEVDWIPMWFSAINNYSTLTAEYLNADYRIISQSGWGVFTSWDNNPHANIPEYYEQVCGLLKGEKNEALGALKEHSFTSWQPDVVVVNLGTNDSGAFQSPEWKDEVTGQTHKQRLCEDGSYNEEDLGAFEEAVQNFLIKLRKNNKNAHIVWAYGMLGIPLMPAIYRAADTYMKKTGDKKIYVFQIPNTTDETVGSRSHPGVLAHKKTAQELSEFIVEILAK
ncbi:SGNH/GDSL hydrolase family protein [Paenibacillus wynnii]|uniref:SGNH/GDSL hydrolase family protein n=1 Tax=Paenibacillus wynnii TaxID=268407 RepID=UPI0027901D30|nr:SGNH/GDSL hydrolase family protein [Paenibacillus wynnii]MDQ0192825.1 lysophospholipase L1-like esterase [Paenibacillus wynnii]